MRKEELLMNAMFEDLPYRKNLDIQEPFGLEIEMGLMNPEDKDYIYNEELKSLSYKTQKDNSILHYEPLEIVTPLLHDEEITWNTLNTLSERMKKCELDFDTSSVQINLDINYTDEELEHMLLFFHVKLRDNFS